MLVPPHQDLYPFHLPLHIPPGIYPAIFKFRKLYNMGATSPGTYGVGSIWDGVEAGT